MDEDLLRRNPANQIEAPEVVALSPRELDDEQRYILKNLVEAQESPKLSAIFGMAYWAALRISEVAQLKVAHCNINQRAGSIKIVDAKGGKTRTIDLHNHARRPLYAYLYETKGPDARDPESVYDLD